MFCAKKPVSPIPEAVFLATVTDNITIGLVEGMLTENKIPFLKQSRGSGGYLQIVCGASPFGTDFFVRKEHLPQARELLRVYLHIQEETE